MNGVISGVTGGIGFYFPHLLFYIAHCAYILEEKRDGRRYGGWNKRPPPNQCLNISHIFSFEDIQLRGVLLR